MSSGAFPSSVVRIHEVSSSVPSYPIHWTRYSSLHWTRQLSTLESKTSAISNLGSLSTYMGGGGGWEQPGMVLAIAGSSMDMWNMGWTAQRLSESLRVTE